MINSSEENSNSAYEYLSSVVQFNDLLKRKVQTWTEDNQEINNIIKKLEKSKPSEMSSEINAIKNSLIELKEQNQKSINKYDIKNFINISANLVEEKVEELSLEFRKSEKQFMGLKKDLFLILSYESVKSDLEAIKKIDKTLYNQFTPMNTKISDKISNIRTKLFGVKKESVNPDKNKM